jgi:hypothetical protein
MQKRGRERECISDFPVTASSIHAKRITELTRSIQFSCTFSCRFLKIGVNRGRRSRIGGVILVIPITLIMARRAPKIEPNTSGYSSPRYSYKTTPRCPMSWSSPQAFITTAIRPIRSAACMRTEADLLLSLHLIVPAICFR